jgi:hypothetical protein
MDTTTLENIDEYNTLMRKAEIIKALISQFCDNYHRIDANWITAEEFAQMQRIRQEMYERQAQLYDVVKRCDELLVNRVPAACDLVSIEADERNERRDLLDRRIMDRRNENYYDDESDEASDMITDSVRQSRHVFVAKRRPCVN